MSDNMDETFSVWVPLQKSLSIETADGLKSRRIVKGIGSTQAIDSQGERILQEGIDYSPFLKSGFLNWNHKPGPENILGRPTSVKILSGQALMNEAGGRSVTGPALVIEGFLYDEVPAADAVWNLLEVMEKARNDGLPGGSLGMSVEGSVARRAGQVLATTVMRHCAITHEPVNEETWLGVAKAVGCELTQNPEYDVRKAKHYAFDSIESMYKAMTTANAAPLSLENLAGTITDSHAVEQALFGECVSNHAHNTKTRHGLFDHLAYCKSFDPYHTKDLLIRLQKALHTTY